jgi:hypothetical protein
MPNRVEVTSGTVLSCVVELNNPRSEDLVIWIEPLPFMFSQRTDKLSESCGCRWLGLIRTHLCKENGFRAEFKFGAFGSGIFQAPGFLVGPGKDFPNNSQILLSQSIQIILR